MLLLGQGNFDIFHSELDGKPFEGLTVRLLDPHTRLWTIYWADSNGMKLDGGKVGSFDGDTGEFFARDAFAGKNVIYLRRSRSVASRNRRPRAQKSASFVSSSERILAE